MANSYDAEASLLKNIADTLGTMSGDSSQSTSYGDDYNENGPFDLKLKYLQKMSDSLDTIAGGGFGEDIFWVTYNETTSSEIESAIESGKLPVLSCDLNASYPNKPHLFMPLAHYYTLDNQSSFIFSSLEGSQIGSGARMPTGKIYYTVYTHSVGYDFWSPIAEGFLAPSAISINGHPLSDNISITSNDIDYDESFTYDDDTIGKKLSNLSNPDNNVFTFTALPVYNEFNEITTYTLGREQDDIYGALTSGKIVQCYIKRNDKIFNTIVSYSGNDQAGYSIAVRPIIQYSNHGDVPSFYIFWDVGGQFNRIELDVSEYRYILPSISIDDPMTPYAVPMMDGSNTGLYMETINEYIDFDTTIDQLIIGAITLADQNGQADISTYIDDSSTVETAGFIIEECERDISHGRGAVARFQYGLNEFYANVSSFSNQQSHKSITFMFEISGADFVNDTFAGAELYTGRITMDVHYTSDGEGNDVADYTVGIIHITKHSASAV